MSVPRLRAPIVLLHGLMGFGRFEFCGRTIASYFSSIPEMLQAAGNRVLTPHVSPTQGVADRAARFDLGAIAARIVMGGAGVMVSDDAS